MNVLVRRYPPPEDLAMFYVKAKEEELLEAFFHEWEEIPTLIEFLGWAMETGSVTIGAYFHGPSSEMIGIGKVSPPKRYGRYSKAEVGIVFLREYQVRSTTLAACNLMLDVVFENYSIDVLFGSLPERNRASLLFMKAIGFEHNPQPIPYYTVWKGDPCGMFVSWMTRKRWKELLSLPDF